MTGVLAATILGIITDKLQTLALAKQPAPILSRSASVERILTKQQIAAYLQVSMRTVENLMKRRDLPHYKIGKAVRFKLSHVEDYLDASCLIKGKG